MKQTHIPAAYLPVFCREMCQLTHSGIPAAEGLSLLREDETDPSVLAWLDALCERAEDGAPHIARSDEKDFLVHNKNPPFRFIFLKGGYHNSCPYIRTYDSFSFVFMSSR